MHSTTIEQKELGFGRVFHDERLHQRQRGIHHRLGHRVGAELSQGSLPEHLANVPNLSLSSCKEGNIKERLANHAEYAQTLRQVFHVERFSPKLSSSIWTWTLRRRIGVSSEA